MCCCNRKCNNYSCQHCYPRLVCSGVCYCTGRCRPGYISYPNVWTTTGATADGNVFPQGSMISQNAR